MRQLNDVTTLEQDMVDDAVRHFEKRELELGASTMREVERQVLLRIIDQRCVRTSIRDGLSGEGTISAHRPEGPSR